MSSTLQKQTLELVENKYPKCKAGNYTVSIQQEIRTNGQKQEKIKTNNLFYKDQTFFVSGKRFTLSPQDIIAVFPPNAGLGEYIEVLPHIVLSSSTLPWERSINQGKSASCPWLCLLLFTEDEYTATHSLTLKELKHTDQREARFPDMEYNYGDTDQDRVTVLDVSKKILEAMIPSEKNLKYSAHVRRLKDEKGEALNENSVLIGQRLPEKGKLNTVHLVSLENRFNQQGSFDFQNTSDTDSIRLISLFRWEFRCEDRNQDFRGLLLNLDRNSFRMPSLKNESIEEYLSKGYIPLKHYMREGSQTISWYHGPLIPGKKAIAPEVAGINLPARCPDELLIYNQQTGMFDVAYAAAWELGRLLALKNQTFLLGFNRWKKALKHAKLSKENKAIRYMPNSIQSTATDLPNSIPYTAMDMPKNVTDWIEELKQLKYIPYNYLTIDERMLPAESIRFFYIDSIWMNCLLDGAFSIGRIGTSGLQEDSQIRSDYSYLLEYENNPVTGFLINSVVLAGWPDIQVDAYRVDGKADADISETDKLQLITEESLSKSARLYLYQGELLTVDIHLKPILNHFELDYDRMHHQYYKILKNGSPMVPVSINELPWENKDKKVLDLCGLADRIKAKREQSVFTSAQLAKEMMKGVEMVRFCQGK